MRVCARLRCATCTVLALLIQLASTAPLIRSQIHSYDDLRLWPQAFAKGAQWAKIDPHYMNASFCASQPRVAQDPRGCFVLSHDVPVTSRAYNSTDDVLAFVTDPKNSVFFANPARRAAIAWCFKLDVIDPCSNSTEARNYLSLVTDLYNTLLDLPQRYESLNVQFIFDGDVVPLDYARCMDDLWTALPATWTGVPPQELEGAFANDTARGLDRYSIFDMPVPHELFDLMADIGYGKFGKASSPWPLLVWEPSAQDEILAVAHKYASHEQVDAGMRFAINIDPVQFAVYAAPVSAAAWNVPLVANAFAPLFVQLSAGSAATSAIQLLTIFLESASWAPSNSSISSTSPSSAAAQPLYAIYGASSENLFGDVPVARAPAQPLPVECATCGAWDGTAASACVLEAPNATASLLVVICSRGAFWRYALDGETNALGLIDGAVVADDLASSCASASGLAIMALTSVAGMPNCLVELMGIANVNEIEPLGCVGAGASGLKQAADVADLSLALISLNTSSQRKAAAPVCAVARNGSVLVAAGLLTLSSANAQIFGAVLCLYASPATGVLALAPTALQHFDVGANSRLAAMLVPASDGTDILLVGEVHGDGYCWNSETNNKQPTPATCDNEARSTPHIMNYNIGALGAWNAFFAASAPTPNATLSPCTSVGVLHGTFDTGARPQLALWLTVESNVVVLVLHESLAASAEDVSGCGFAVATDKPSILLDGWVLDGWVPAATCTNGRCLGL